MPDLGDAPGLAATLLDTPDLAMRWTHVQGVAARARQLASTIEPCDRDLLIAAAWLHDIGYSPLLVDTGLHSLDGARYLQRLGYPDRLCGLIAYHSDAYQRALLDPTARRPAVRVDPLLINGFDDDLDDPVGDTYDVDDTEAVQAKQQRSRVMHARGLASVGCGRQTAWRGHEPHSRTDTPLKCEGPLIVASGCGSNSWIMSMTLDDDRGGGAGA